MESNKVLSALCYFSMLFAGIIFPLIVYLVVSDPVLKMHAKKALLSHLIPLIGLPLLAISIFIDFSRGNQDFPILVISCVILTVLISIMVLIWNIVKGVMVLKEK